MRVPPVDHAARLRLAPGLRVVPRGRDRLQVGLYAERRVLLPREPVVEATLSALLDRTDLPEDPEAGRVLDRLAGAGCLTTREIPRTVVRPHRVAVLGALPGIDPAALLATAGAEPAPAARCDVALVLSRGEIARERLDPLVRSGTTHLVVRFVDGAAIVGPFVVPGVSACLRCVDAECTVADPDHATIVARYARASSRAREDGCPDVADPLLTQLALTWALRDVVAHCEGRRASTWSGTVVLTAEPGPARVEQRRRHPECGCSWPALAHVSGTMGV